MRKCEYYHEEKTTLEFGEGQAGRESDVTELDIRWCSHRHATVDRDAAWSANAGEQLECEGTLDKCPLTPEEYADV